MLLRRHYEISECSATIQCNPGLETRPGPYNPDSQAVNNLIDINYG